MDYPISHRKAFIEIYYIIKDIFSDEKTHKPAILLSLIATFSTVTSVTFIVASIMVVGNVFFGSGHELGIILKFGIISLTSFIMMAITGLHLGSA